MSNKALRIGIVCPYNIFRHGGVQESIYAHSKVLRQRGHSVKIISPRPRTYDGPVPENVCLIGLSTDVDYPFKTKADISFTMGRSEMKDLLRKERFDILHFHEPWVPLFPRQLLRVAKEWQIPCVATFHAKWPEAFLYRTFGKAIRPLAKSIVKDFEYICAASEPGSHYVNTLLGMEVPIIYNGIDLTRFDPMMVNPIEAYTDQRQTILYLNRLEKRKGPDLLLYAYQKLYDILPNVRLLIASDGAMREKLEDYVALYDLRNVEFLGFVDDLLKVRLFRSADLFTAPSPYGEGFGIVLLEAMAMGVPYIAGNNPGYRYASADKAEAYTVDPYNAQAYADAMHRMLTDESKRFEYSLWAKKRIRQFDYDHIVQKYEKVYYRVIEAKLKES